jgi:hypothetical protein
LLSAAAACTSDGSDDTSSTTTEPGVAVRPAVDIADITIDNTWRNRAITRGEREALVVDGLHHTGDGRGSHVRVWVVPFERPKHAVPVDLYDAGPRGLVTAWWWDGVYGILGVRCPDPDPAGLDSDVVATICGDATFDLFTFDPTTNEVDRVMADWKGQLPNEGPEGLYYETSNDVDALLRSGFTEPYLLVARDGTTSEIPAPERPGGPIVAFGDSFLAARQPYQEDQAYAPDPPKPVADLLRISRLVDGEWHPEALPATDLAFHHLRVEVATSGGLLLSAYREEYDRGTRVPQPVTMLEIGEGGVLSWQQHATAADFADALGFVGIGDLLAVERNGRWAPVMTDGELDPRPESLPEGVPLDEDVWLGWQADGSGLEVQRF